MYAVVDADAKVVKLAVFEADADAAVTAGTGLVKHDDTVPSWVEPGNAVRASDGTYFALGNPLQQLNDARDDLFDQYQVWWLELPLYPEVMDFGRGAIERAWEGTADYAADTTYTVEIRTKGLRNLALGTSDGIDSGRILAERADQFPPAQRVFPAGMLFWINRATGERVTLQEAMTGAWGTRPTDFHRYSRPVITA